MKSLVKPNSDSKLLSDIKKLIEESKNFVAAAVNASMTMLFWKIGKRINQDILLNKRAEYGKQIVVTLSRQLVQEYGNSFEEKNLRRMIQFASVFPEEEIVASVSRQLSWSHFVVLIPLKPALQREFYAEMCRTEKWSVRTLREKIELLQLGKTGIKVAEYITELPDKKILRQRLQQAIEISKRRLELGDVQ